MCGIAGMIGLQANYKPNELLLRRMMLEMKHRGPDDEGVMLHNNVGLGFVRLSILDLSSAGHQPMQDSSERYSIVFNGEIYNYIELRQELEKLGVTFKTHTDTEVLLQCYI